MVDFTPEFAGNSLVVLGISYVITIGFSLYSLYLNYKQSKVNNQMAELLKEAEEQRKLLARILETLEKK